MATDDRSNQANELPEPNAELAPAGTPPTTMTEASVKGVLIDPLNAGAGQFPATVSDAQWVAACERLLKQDGPRQFLVNLLFVLRQSLGT